MTQNREKRMDKLEEWKKEYQSMTVPKEVKDRIRMGIAKAQEEKQSEEKKAKEKQPEAKAFAEKSYQNRENRDYGKKQRGVVFMMKRVGMSAAAAMIAIVVLANSSASVALAMEKIPVLGSIAKVVTFRDYTDKSNHFEADISIPKLEGENGSEVEANKNIEEYANQLIAQYEADLQASSGEGNYSLTSSYDVAFENEKYVCIRIHSTMVMASGTEFVKVFTVDKETGKTVSLAELVKNKSGLLDKISDTIKEQMEEQMAADDSVTYFYHSEVPELDFQGLSGEESYYFNANGELVISFDEYEVAPGYMGAVSFTIPKEVTGELSK